MNTIDLLAVFNAILTGRQSGQKLQSLYGNSVGKKTFSKIELPQIPGRRLYSPSLKDVAWLEDTEFFFL